MDVASAGARSCRARYVGVARAGGRFERWTRVVVGPAAGHAAPFRRFIRCESAPIRRKYGDQFWHAGVQYWSRNSGQSGGRLARGGAVAASLETQSLLAPVDRASVR